MFRKGSSFGAQFVMSGDHEKHSVPPAYEALLEYWEKVFIQKSKSDCRPLERAIDTFEEMDEIIQALENLKDSAPGLDGMKKCYLNKIAPEDMATHSGCSAGVPQMCSKKELLLVLQKTKTTEYRQFQDDRSWTNHW